MRRWLYLVLLSALLIASFAPLTVRAQETPSAEQQASRHLIRLTPQERVGQLFLVTFDGTEVGETSQIYDLIVNYHVGGVMLSTAHDNFAAAPNTVAEAYRLIAALQQVEQTAAALTINAEGTPVAADNTDRYVPLFVGIAQEGGGYPNDQLLSGVTALPSEMAIGATWNPSLAEQAGQVMGRELELIGFNMYLGLSLDVLSSPNPLQVADLGTRVFGGDPYWVSVMSRAFIGGMHTGGRNRIAVVARHFPGRGESDRRPEEEVATVRKSLEQLKQIELAPFFNVTGNAPAPQYATDALLVSHIRYQGFQGNIRATTRPVSFDPQALSLILGLPEFVSWRQNGGLMISDDLGSQAVKQFYDPSNTSFQARLVARDAFLAGNDLLYMGNIISTDAPDNHSTLVQTLDFFAQKYEEDPAFAQRVDESVLRILTLKYRLYEEFIPENVTSPESQLAAVGVNAELAFNIAQQSATLISPELRDLDTVLPSAPTIFDRMIFITDTRQVWQCGACEPTTVLPKDALRNAVVRLYGPSAGGQVNANALTFYTFDELGAYLDPQAVPPQSMDGDLKRSTWIVFSTLDLEPGGASITTLRRFLTEKQNIIRNKNIILFSFSAPYYLDATDISRLTAYYGLYSPQTPFVDMAARLLFRELTPLGSLPVSMPAINYDLIAATVPDPNQVIELILDVPPAPTPADPNTPQSPETPLFKVGDTINLRTNVILDKNQRQVPDNTLVTFQFSLVDEGIFQTEETSTSDGVAKASFRLDRSGLVEIRAYSEPARESVVLQLNITNEGSAVTVVPPTPEPTHTQAVPQVLVPGTPEPKSIFVANGHPLPMAWAFVMVMLLIGALAAFIAGSRIRSPRWGLRWGFCVLVGGLVAYNYHSLGLVGSAKLIESSGFTAVWQLVLAGELAGWLVGWVWERNSTRQRRDQAEQ